MSLRHHGKQPSRSRPPAEDGHANGNTTPLTDETTMTAEEHAHLSSRNWRPPAIVPGDRVAVRFGHDFVHGHVEEIVEEIVEGTFVVRINGRLGAYEKTHVNYAPSHSLVKRTRKRIRKHKRRRGPTIGARAWWDISPGVDGPAIATFGCSKRHAGQPLG